MPTDFVHETEWCELASKWTLAPLAWYHGRSDRLRYVIVGNYKAGFCGIEREMDIPSQLNVYGQYCWRYQHLDEKECRRVLKGRLCV